MTLGRLLCSWRSNPGATPELITAATSPLGRALPADYLQFMREGNGGEGFVGRQYLMLWRIEELERFNLEYEVEKYAKGIVLFGSDGGGDAYGFDTASVPAGVVRVPFVGMNRRLAIPVTFRFADLSTASTSHESRSSERSRQHMGLELCELTPVLLGGEPLDTKNKIWLTRDRHFEFVRFWNRIVDAGRTSRERD